MRESYIEEELAVSYRCHDCGQMIDYEREHRCQGRRRDQGGSDRRRQSFLPPAPGSGKANGGRQPQGRGYDQGYDNGGYDQPGYDQGGRGQPARRPTDRANGDDRSRGGAAGGRGGSGREEPARSASGYDDAGRGGGGGPRYDARGAPDPRYNGGFDDPRGGYGSGSGSRGGSGGDGRDAGYGRSQRSQDNYGERPRDKSHGRDGGNQYAGSGARYRDEPGSMDRGHDDSPQVMQNFCGGCNKRIVDETQAFEIDAMGKFFHANCFRCCICNGLFSEDLPFIPHGEGPDSKAYCERDYDLYANPSADICAACNKQIEDVPVQALGKMWHEHHLTCYGCQQPVRGNFFEHKGVVYCASDYARMVAPNCKGCRKPIQGETVVALDAAWHKRCFGCTTCQRPFPYKSFYVLNNLPYCKIDYHRANNSLCGTCGDPIEGPCADVQEINKRFHPNCWCCSMCRVPLTDIYYSYEGEVYCENDIRAVYKPSRGGNAQKRRTLLGNI